MATKVKRMSAEDSRRAVEHMTNVSVLRFIAQDAREYKTVRELAAQRLKKLEDLQPKP